ncbi:MAG: YfiR family protein, partial [Terriglobia bacterium]
PFGAILDRTLEGESVNNHAVRARRLLSDGDLRSCHILFISRSERERFAQIVSRLRGSSVLTVSELPGFADAGGMIEFIVEEGKARFSINTATTEAAGLRLSSRLLRVAKEIKRS